MSENETRPAAEQQPAPEAAATDSEGPAAEQEAPAAQEARELGSVAVLTLAHNEPRDALDRSVRSSLAAGADQVVLVDDGSDEPVENVWGDQVELVRLEENRGIAAAGNAGIERVRCDWLARLMADDEMHPEKLELQLRFMSQVGAVASFHDHIELYPDGQFVERRYQGPADVSGALRHDNKFYGGTTLVRMDVVRELGPRDESLVYCHDWDWHARLGLRYPWAHLPEALVIRHMRDTGASARAARNSQEFNREFAVVHRRFRAR